MKVLLALDPGTRCGWAVRSACGDVASDEKADAPFLVDYVAEELAPQ